MVNASKKKDVRYWIKWYLSGALGFDDSSFKTILSKMSMFTTNNWLSCSDDSVRLPVYKHDYHTAIATIQNVNGTGKIFDVIYHNNDSGTSHKTLAAAYCAVIKALIHFKGD